MNAKRVIKFNIVMSLLSLVLTISMLIATTFAYFSDRKESVNVITSGNVYISLSESATKKDAVGNLIADPDKPRVFGGNDIVVNDYGKVYPAQTVFKDPTITNTGSEAAWIAAKVTLTDGQGDLTKVMGYYGFEGIDIEMLLSGGLLDEKVHVGTWNGFNNVCYNEHYAMVQIPDASAGEFEFYFFLMKPLDPGESVMLFDTFGIPHDWNNPEMKELMDLKIKVEAFGVQLFDLESCLVAMTSAFPDYFKLE